MILKKSTTVHILEKVDFSNNARPLNYITSSVNERKYG